MSDLAQGLHSDTNMTFVRTWAQPLGKKSTLIDLLATNKIEVKSKVLSNIAVFGCFPIRN